jgi:hypothetical protein
MALDRDPETLQHNDVSVVILVSYTALQEAIGREREVGAAARARPAHQEVVGGGRGGGRGGRARGIGVFTIPPVGPLYSGEGCTLTPFQGT